MDEIVDAIKKALKVDISNTFFAEGNTIYIVLGNGKLASIMVEEV